MNNDGNDIIIKVRGISKKFGNLQVLKNVDLDVHRGEKIAIIGASGCGKSVFLRCCEMLCKPDSGSVYICGEDICAKGANIDRIRRKTGMVYQQYNLFEHMNIMDNLCLAPTRLLKMPRAEAELKAKALLAEVGLSGRENAMPENMSGGQQQRVAIARCLMMSPEVMFMDEPTSALDPTMVGEVMATIRALGKQGMTMLIVTHEMNFAREFADRILFFADGGIYEEGTPEQIFDYPKREKTIRFVQKLKYFTYHIDSKDYDFMAVIGGIMSFCERYNMNSKHAWRLQLCTEELLNLLISKAGDIIDMDVSVEYSETEKYVTLNIEWRGAQYNPFSDNDLEDNLGITIVNNVAADIRRSFSDGVNRIEITMN